MTTTPRNNYVLDCTQPNKFTILFFLNGIDNIQVSSDSYKSIKPTALIIPPLYYCKLHAEENNYISIDFDVDDLHIKNKLLLFKVIFKPRLLNIQDATTLDRLFDSTQFLNVNVVLSFIFKNNSDIYKIHTNTETLFRSYKYAYDFYCHLLSTDLKYSLILVKNFCDCYGICSRTLNRACLLIFGVSSHDIIKRAIEHKAVSNLLHTSDSIKEIAFEMGFSEPSNFCRFMKKYTGYTPKEIRALA